MIELKKCECGARPDVDFDLGDVITLCPSCRRLRRYPGLGTTLRASLNNAAMSENQLYALLGELVDGSGINTDNKGKKNE